QTHEPYRVRLRAVAEIDPLAAACAAADHVLSDLYPSRASHFHAVRDEVLDALPDGPAQRRGRALGVHVARRLLDDRKLDSGKGDYRAPAAVGIWRPTPPGHAAPLMPGWGDVRPFGVRDKKAFTPADPPDLTNDEYAKDFNEVKALGGIDSTARTADQTLIALFWNDGAGTCTPPGHWNLIAQEASYARKLTLAENARLFALLNLALADAGVCCWDCKFRFKLWRPITAIHQADRDANDATVPNGKWASLLNTPPFPTYTSGHSTFSGAGAAALAGYFEDDALGFVVGSDGLTAQRRRYKGFREAAEEAGRSRIYGGIQFECDNREGLAVGKAIAEEILRTRLVPEDRRAVTSVPPVRESP
ncbi:MAG: vanadium-dependent haloperoxidase, partial [Gemmataceae bacterium]